MTLSSMLKIVTIISRSSSILFISLSLSKRQICAIIKSIINTKFPFCANDDMIALMSTFRGFCLKLDIASFISFSFFSMSLSFSAFDKQLSPMNIQFSPGEKSVQHKYCVYYALSLISSTVLFGSWLFVTRFANSTIFLTNGFEFELTRSLNEIFDKLSFMFSSKPCNILLNSSWHGAVSFRKSMTPKQRFKNALSSMHDYFSAYSTQSCIDQLSLQREMIPRNYLSSSLKSSAFQYTLPCKFRVFWTINSYKFSSLLRTGKNILTLQI